MKKAILTRFMAVMAIALGVCGVLVYLVVGNTIMSRTRDDLTQSLRVLDGILNYDEIFSSQLEKLNLDPSLESWRLTILGTDGTVWVDTGVKDELTMDNHLEREEVQDALSQGIGYAKRYSQTLHTQMFYVALLSSEGDYILRLAAPYSGMTEFSYLFLPVLGLSIGIAFFISFVLADRFSKSVTKPLLDMSDEIMKIQEEDPQFDFKDCEYEELNRIGEKMKIITRSVRDYIKRLEFERQIRQEFFSNASHELKTPITSIKGYAELLSSRMVTDENMRQDFYQRIEKETDHMTRLINDILMISRLEAKEAEVSITQVNLAQVAEDVCRTLKPYADASKVSLTSHCEPVVIEASLTHMTELISNLASNGIKYNKEGGRVEIYAWRTKKNVVIQVTDTGVGIDQEDQKRIFERFYRVDKGRSKRVEGTGLGLSIVKHIVGYYGGTIEVFSRTGEGSTFTVRIPSCKTETIHI